MELPAWQFEARRNGKLNYAVCIARYVDHAFTPDTIVINYRA